MKKQLLLLALIIFGSVFFSSLNNNSTKACDKNRSACFLIKKPVVKTPVAVEYEEDEYSRARIMPFHIVTL